MGYETLNSEQIKKIEMPKYSLILLYLLFSTVGQAQITILPKDLPSENTELPMVVWEDSILIDILPPSNSAQVWDWADALETNSFVGEYHYADYVDFGPVTGTTGEVEFEDSKFSRTSNLRTILGFDIASFLPEADGTAPVPADAYFSNDVEGNVLLDGVAAEIQIDEFDLGRRFLYASPPYRFYSVGEMGDSYSSGTVLVNDIYAEELPENIPLLEYVRLRLDISTTTEIDAYGELILPDTTFSVLRYRETSFIHATLTPWIEILGSPVEFNPSLIPDAAIENLGFDPDEIFFDTIFVSNLYRYYAENITYPVASVNFIGDNPEVETIEHYIEPKEFLVDYSIGYDPEFCNSIFLQNISTGIGMNYVWDFGDGTTEEVYDAPGTLEDPIFLLHEYPESGTYTVTLTGTDALGNTAESIDEVNVYCWATDIETIPNNTTYSLYPNPVLDNLAIALENPLPENGELSIFDTMGKEVFYRSLKAGESKFVVSLAEVSQGTYFVSLTLNNGETILKEKVVK